MGAVEPDEYGGGEVAVEDGEYHRNCVQGAGERDSRYARDEGAVQETDRSIQPGEGEGSPDLKVGVKDRRRTTGRDWVIAITTVRV